MPDLLISIPNHDLIAAMGDALSGVKHVYWDMTNEPPAGHIDIVVPPYMGPPSLLSALTGLSTQLVQSQSIGYDGVEQAMPAGHTFANAVTVHETSTAELTLALVLASQRGLPDFVRSAEAGKYEPTLRPSLADRRVVLIGYGGVGKAIESRLLPFEVDLVRVASSARVDARGQIFGIGDLSGILPRAEVVIVCVPLTQHTHGLIGDGFLSSLPDDALVVNVARGPVADTEAILRHASTGRLRFALDVTDPEPLPPGHPLFALPNVLISPHVGGASSAMLPRMVRLLRNQASRLLAGELPLNVVLKT